MTRLKQGRQLTTAPDWQAAIKRLDDAYSENTLQRMNSRVTPEIMRLRRCIVERPFALLKYVIFGHPRFLLRGLAGAQIETSLATLAYNLKTMFHVLGGCKLTQLLAE